MNTIQKIRFDDLVSLINEYKASPIKEDYLAFIRDISIPLEVRWELFKIAPKQFQKTNKYIVHFDIEKLLPTQKISWHDDFYIEKYETIDLVNIIEDAIPDTENENLMEEKFVDAFKEEILQKNLREFNFDW